VSHMFNYFEDCKNYEKSVLDKMCFIFLNSFLCLRIFDKLGLRLLSEIHVGLQVKCQLFCLVLIKSGIYP
jgi:hypothetical protein